MSEISISGIIIITVIIFIVILIVLRIVTNNVSRNWNRHRAETVDKWTEEGVEFIRGPKGGQFSGLESMGVHKVIRGVGFAAITSKDLRVTRSVPTGEWSIPLKQIKKVTIQPTFMGNRSKKTPFIVVRFKQGGETDKLGFQVTEFEDWAKKLAKVAGVRLQDIRE